ncbi:DUF5798 family protein [Haloquadratum walsbyi]|jgi:archaellum component FlaC|uniref:Uncharacterized protein n=1 Tax=Haloquadratum walsbyi (strain DSM 16790 / HBSQ001) TaxID=362976 RepID=Q18J02_HALWD|nr:DUF5798 family protein [Haloquadratum walsbyi]CAJ52010.1 uncharacterized protein HQ_1882A [Haloquadratum walsbyi DSM 16790]
MGLGTTAKKLQKVTEMAENVYQRLNELRTQISEMRETTGETQAAVDRLETETAEIRALVEAIADEEDIDTETIIANAHITEAEAKDSGSESESKVTSDDPQ